MPISPNAAGRPEPPPVPGSTRAPLAVVALLAAFCSGVAAQDLSAVGVEARQDGPRHRLTATNRTHVPVEIAVALASATNLAATLPLPLNVVVAAGQAREVTVLSAADPRQGYRFSYRFTTLPGDPAARPDPAARYRLPFEDGRRFLVSQAPGGPVLTHNDAQTAMAIDIVMPEGTPVLAARAGLVVDIFEKSATRADLSGRGNFVRVFHDDGTWADYAHLSRTAPGLVPNGRVAAGDLLGLSGNTGQSSGPHLHFHVQRNARGRIVSIPVEFATRARARVRPAAREFLVAD